jgi:hypothetical protein
MLRVKIFLSMPVYLHDVLKRATEIIVLSFICSGYFAAHADTEQQSSRRIEVYSLSQNYWDTQSGDTLGEIVLSLLPNNPAKHEALMQNIVQLNPDAFIGGDPDKLLANKRLWLPGYMKQADSKVDPGNTIVERYSWGNIKRPRN